MIVLSLIQSSLEFGTLILLLIIEIKRLYRRCKRKLLVLFKHFDEVRLELHEMPIVLLFMQGGPYRAKVHVKFFCLDISDHSHSFDMFIFFNAFDLLRPYEEDCLLWFIVPDWCTDELLHLLFTFLDIDEIDSLLPSANDEWERIYIKSWQRLEPTFASVARISTV